MKKLGFLLVFAALLSSLVLAQSSVNCPFDGAPAHLVSKVNHGLTADVLMNISTGIVRAVRGRRIVSIKCATARNKIS
jgi:hypothetical protein